MHEWGAGAGCWPGDGGAGGGAGWPHLLTAEAALPRSTQPHGSRPLAAAAATTASCCLPAASRPPRLNCCPGYGREQCLAHSRTSLQDP